MGAINATREMIDRHHHTAPRRWGAFASHLLKHQQPVFLRQRSSHSSSSWAGSAGRSAAGGGRFLACPRDGGGRRSRVRRDGSAEASIAVLLRRAAAAVTIAARSAAAAAESAHDSAERRRGEAEVVADRAQDAPPVRHCGFVLGALLPVRLPRQRASRGRRRGTIDRTRQRGRCCVRRCRIRNRFCREHMEPSSSGDKTGPVTHQVDASRERAHRLLQCDEARGLCIKLRGQPLPASAAALGDRVAWPTGEGSVRTSTKRLSSLRFNAKHKGIIPSRCPDRIMGACGRALQQTFTYIYNSALKQAIDGAIRHTLQLRRHE